MVVLLHKITNCMPAVLESTHSNKRLFKCSVFIKVNRISYDYLYFYSAQKYSLSPLVPYPRSESSLVIIYDALVWSFYEHK